MEFFQDDNLYNYRYYLKDGETPIRLVLDKKNRTLGAERLDVEGCKFVESANLLRDVNTYAFVDEIDSDEFYSICERLVQRGVRD